jgi:hypothetical protein
MNPVTLPPGVAPITITAPPPLHFGQAIPSLDPTSWQTQIYIANGITIPLWGVVAALGLAAFYFIGGHK